MSFALFDLIGAGMNGYFGNKVLLSLVVIVVISMIVLSLGGNKTVLLMVLLPLIVTITVGTSAVMSIDARWIGVVMWIIAGFFVATFFWVILR